jgi:hypothetical protein
VDTLLEITRSPDFLKIAICCCILALFVLMLVETDDDEDDDLDPPDSPNTRPPIDEFALGTSGGSR